MGIAAAAVVLATALVFVDGTGVATYKHSLVRVKPSSWTATSTSVESSMGECSRVCSETYGCKAFAYDSVSKSCELGKLPNLPSDADPGGKAILVFQPSPDCRSAQAVLEGYQPIGRKYYKRGNKTLVHSAAVEECEAVGGRLAIFRHREDFEAVHAIPGGPPTFTHYWVGATVPAEKGSATCNAVGNSVEACSGFYVWDDGKPLEWSDQDVQEWAAEIQRDQASEFCGMLTYDKFDDGPCSGWAGAFPLCEIDCHLLEV